MIKLSQVIKSLSNFHFPSTKNVNIFSCPRSGSTWLMELIWSQPGFKTINEPLNVRGKVVRDAIGVKNFKEIYESQNKQKVVHYFSEIAKGKRRFLNPSPIRKFYKPFTNRIVYKIINGGEGLINEIAEATKSKKIVFIRHPFPVALSRKQLPRLEVIADTWVMGEFEEKQQMVIEKVLAKNDKLEKAVLSWCIQNKLMLNHCSDALIFTYEQLVVDPQSVIDQLVNFCDLPKPSRIWKQLKVPSAVTVQSSEGTSEQIEGSCGSNLIEKWRQSISEEKASELWEIVDAFGLDIYNKENSLPKEDFKV